MKTLDKILAITTVAGISTVFRYAPVTWEIDPLSTLIVGISLVGTCGWLIFDAFGKN